MTEFLRTLLRLPEQASTFAYRVDRLHFIVAGTTVVAALTVGTAALALFWRYRIRVHGQLTEDVKAPLWLEGLIVGVPLAVFLAWFAVGFSDFVFFTSPPKQTLDVYVEGKQWMWKFAYPEGPNGLDVLRVPSGRPVRLLMTSRDVIHSVFIPAFRAKMDVLPGRYTSLWFEATREGTFPLFCTEFCGTGHSAMVGEVVVMAPAAFDAWLEAQRRGRRGPVQDGAPLPSEHPAPLGDLRVQGQRVAAELGCFKCHTVDGTQHIGPTWRGLYGRKRTFLDGSARVADEAYLTESMMDPGAHVVAGNANIMPTYRGRLAGPEAAALVEFIKSLRADPPEDVPTEEPAHAPAR